MFNPYLKNMRIPGATPNETRSASESSSFPISLETLSILAILPSYLSTKAARIIHNAAIK